MASCVYCYNLGYVTRKNAMIFYDKVRNSENLWDSIHFLALFGLFVPRFFKGTPLNVLQLDWLAACNSFGLV